MVAFTKVNPDCDLGGVCLTNSTLLPSPKRMMWLPFPGMHDNKPPKVYWNLIYITEYLGEAIL